MIYFLPILVLVLDQLSKYFIDLNKDLSIILIPNLLEIVHVYNSGSIFGLLNGTNDIVLIMALIIVAVLVIYLYLKKNVAYIQKLGYLLILSGAIGNILDRLFRGAVVDFIYIPIINFPVFNIADIAICIGIGLLVIDLFKKKG